MQSLFGFYCVAFVVFFIWCPDNPQAVVFAFFTKCQLLLFLYVLVRSWCRDSFNFMKHSTFPLLHNLLQRQKGGNRSSSTQAFSNQIVLYLYLPPLKVHQHPWPWTYLKTGAQGQDFKTDTLTISAITLPEILFSNYIIIYILV